MQFRIGLVPSLLQSCRRGPREPFDAAAAGALAGQGSGASADAPWGHDQEMRLEINRLFLTGILLADPQDGEGPEGEPVSVLLMAFPAPNPDGTAEQIEIATCEVEVSERVIESHVEKLQAGSSVAITGQIRDGGGVIATVLHSGPPF